jgi:hypothetical protein
VGGVLLLLFSASFQRASSHPICEFTLRTDKAGFRVVVTLNEWQKRQWVVVSGVKGRAAQRIRNGADPILLGIKGRGGERDMIPGRSSDRIGPGGGEEDNERRSMTGCWVWQEEWEGG